MKISTGNLKVIDSGMIYSYKNGSVCFDLDPQLQVTFSFQDDPKIAEYKINYHPRGENHIELVCVNFNDATGIGYVNPQLIGTINDENVYLYFWITKVGTEVTTKKIEYTWYIGKDSNGN